MNKNSKCFCSGLDNPDMKNTINIREAKYLNFTYFTYV